MKNMQMICKGSLKAIKKTSITVSYFLLTRDVPIRWDIGRCFPRLPGEVTLASFFFLKLFAGGRSFCHVSKMVVSGIQHSMLLGGRCLYLWLWYTAATPVNFHKLTTLAQLLSRSLYTCRVHLHFWRVWLMSPYGCWDRSVRETPEGLILIPD